MDSEQMKTLAAMLEGGGVPAILATKRGAALLIGNSHIIYGDTQGFPVHFLIGLALTSPNAGLGLDVGPAMSEHCKAAIRGLLTWVRAAGVAYENGVQNASTTLYSEMGELFDRNMLERAECNREFSPESFVFLTGNEDQLKRNAHTEPRVPTGGNVVDWSALLMPGGLRPFVISVIWGQSGVQVGRTDAVRSVGLSWWVSAL